MQIGSLSLLASDRMGALDYVLAVVALLAGLGAFLFGFKVLSDNIEKLATNRLRRWFEKTGRSRLAGVGIGAGVTAIIQSSSATTVMVVGFVNVGLMSLFQATTVIMGAQHRHHRHRLFFGHRGYPVHRDHNGAHLRGHLHGYALQKGQAQDHRHDARGAGAGLSRAGIHGHGDERFRKTRCCERLFGQCR